MSLNYPTNRRAFMKKAVATTGIASGIIGSAETVAAADQSVDIYGYADGSEYTIYVNDGNAYGGSNLESDDGVDNVSGKSRLSGTVDDGDTDTYHFTGQVTDVVLYGDLSMSVNNPNGMNIWGQLTVEGTDGYYSARVSDSLSKTSNCESSDDVSGGTVNGELNGSDTDTFDVDGTLEYATVLPGSYISFTHDF